MKALVINDDQRGTKSLYDANITGTGDKHGDRISLQYSDLDKDWIEPGALAGSAMVYGDGVLLTIDNTEVWFDWSQIEIVGMLYKLYNEYFTGGYPSETTIKE